jgi:hypothetical protein
MRQFSVGPVFGCLPQSIYTPTKLAARFNLLPNEIGLFHGKEAGMRLASHGMREAVVRAVPSLGVMRTSATGLAAFDGAFRQRTPPHGLRIA